LVASGLLTLLAGVGILATDKQHASHDWGWALAGVGILAILVGGLRYLWLMRSDEETAPRVGADADDHSTAIAAGRDVRIRDYYAAPAATPARPPRQTPSFDLQHQPRSDGSVHLLLTNHVEAGTFHVDVTRIEKALTDETTPYSVKWRGDEGEDRHVVTSTLIDLAYVEPPWYDDPNSTVVFITGRRRVNNWLSGRFLLYSHSCQPGWDVEAEPVQGPEGMPAHIALYLEEVVIHVLATRIDSKEKVKRVVTIGFSPPTWNSQSGAWETSKAIRVEVQATQ
jgi:hypothetical protein